jgi:uncharacterized OB-fold protein
METKKCPFCGKTVLALSKVCKHCGMLFEENQIIQEEIIDETPQLGPIEVIEEVKTPTLKRIETKKCPACSKTVLAISEICKHCGKSFEVPGQEEKPETTIFQQTNNEPESFESVDPKLEQQEQEPTEFSQLNDEEPEIDDSNQNLEPFILQSTSFVEQQKEDDSQQNSSKPRQTKIIKWIVYVIGAILVIGVSAIWLINKNELNRQTQESLQLSIEDTVPAEEKVQSNLGLEPTIHFSTPTEIVTSSGEYFSVVAGDFFIGVVDKNGNPENGKLYDKNGRQKHIILPKSNH